MKTMKVIDYDPKSKFPEIVRVKESMVHPYLTQGYTFCPKSEWKAQQAKSGSLEAKASP